MSRLAHSIIISAFIGALGIIAGFISIRIDKDENSEEKIDLDLLFRLRGKIDPPSDVVIVSIDRASADNLHLPCRADEWPRCHHARITEILAKQGASVIVFDIIFKKPGDPADDKSFANAIKTAGNVALCQLLEQTDNGNKIADMDSFIKNDAIALAPFPLPKNPGNKRWYRLFFSVNADAIPTLPVVAFQIFSFEAHDELIRLLKKYSYTQDKNEFMDEAAIRINRQAVEQLMALRNRFINDPEIGEKILDEIDNPENLSSDPKNKQLLKSLIEIYRGDMSQYLNFYGPPGTIKTIPYHEILTNNGESLDFKGKAVFIGSSDNLQPEKPIDGYDTVYPGEKGLKMSGVEIAATAFSNLLERKHIKPVVIPVYFLTIILWALIISIICFFPSPGVSVLSLITLSFIYLWFALYQFTKAGVWYPVTIPLFIQCPAAYLCILLFKFFRLKKERQGIREAFKHYLPEPVVDQLTQTMGDVKANTQIVYGTCLFTDGEQYTALSENMDPKELSIFMNSYYEYVFEPVRRYGGIISDIIGDSMLSIWATAQPDIMIRKNACRAALAISMAVKQFKENANTMHLPTRIGLHSGYISIGNVGAIDHYEYRPVGNIVNTASRIENLNKLLGTRILISREVLQQIDEFITRKIGSFIFLGKSKVVEIYELVSLKEESSEQQRDLCAIFTEGLTAYYRQSWDEAIYLLQKSLETCKHDGPSVYYLAKCEECRKVPPGEDWNGTIRLESK